MYKMFEGNFSLTDCTLFFWRFSPEKLEIGKGIEYIIE